MNWWDGEPYVCHKVSLRNEKGDIKIRRETKASFGIGNMMNILASRNRDFGVAETNFRDKSPAKWGVQIAGMIFQTGSKHVPVYSISY